MAKKGAVPIGAGKTKQQRYLETWMRSALMDPERARDYGVVALAEHEVKALLLWEEGSPGPGVGFDYGLGVHRIRRVDAGEPRYLQREGSANLVLVPQGHGVDWSAQLPALYITEGEKKAHALTALGCPCLGIGGVQNWSVRETDGGARKLHPTIEEHRARAGTVVVVFDSNRTTNENVSQAEHALVRTLKDAGSRVLVLAVPKKSDGTDQGVDDWLQQWKTREQRLSAMMALVEEATDHEHDAVLAANARWKMVLNVGLPEPYVYDNGSRRSLSGFDRIYRGEKVLVKNLKGNLVERSLTEWWRVQPLCEKYDRVAFHTSRLRPVPDRVLNLYHPPTVPDGYKRPKMYDVLDFLAVTVPEEEERRWLLSWVAYAVQKGEKPRWCVFVWGPQGSGKTFLGVLLGACFTPYYHGIKIGDLARETFGNKNFEGVRFLHADEGDDSDESGRDLKNKLKHPLTSSDLLVEEKHVPAYKIDNQALVYLSSNYQNSLHIEPSDRRTLALRVPAKTQKSVEAARRLNIWLRGTDSMDAPVLPSSRWALWEFFDQYPVREDFNASDAPMTEEKAEMIKEGRSEMERRVHAAATEGEWCGYHVPEVVMTKTLGQLSREGAPDSAIREEVVRIGRALAQAGCVGRTIKREGKTEQYWAIRNVDAWRARANEAWLEEASRLPTRG